MTPHLDDPAQPANMQAPHAPLRGRSPAWDGLLAGLATLGVALASGGLLYARAVRAFQDEVRQGLVRTASSAAQLVDVRLHETLTTPDQESTEDYARAIEPLGRLLEGAEGVAFVYTCVLRPDGVHFVLDPTPEGDADGGGVDDKSHVMELYPDADPAMLQALRSGRPGFMDEPLADAWGTFVSGYAPLRSLDGRLIGVVGVDMHAEAYVARLAGLRAAGGLGLAAALAAALVVGVVQRAHRARALVAEDETRRLLCEVTAARRRAEAALVSKGDLLATLSHELRTPMSGVIGTLGLIEGTPLDAQQRELSALARSSATSLVRLVDDILDASRLEAGRVELEAIPFSPRALVGDVVKLLGASARRGVALSCLVDPAVPAELMGDPARLTQVVTNLLGNALKFTERGSVTVRVSAAPADRGRIALQVEVADTGIGIAKDSLPRLFSAFSQAESSTLRRFGGSGLGLAVSRGLVELMGGELTVQSEPSRGSTFRVSVPLPSAVAA